MSKDLDRLYGLIEDMGTSVLVTRRADGHLVPRAVAKLHQAPGADLWFLTTDASGRLQDFDADPHATVLYMKPGSREWISLSGVARVSRDRALIDSLYSKSWKLWFDEQKGDDRYGTANDPRVVLIGLDLHSAVVFEKDKPNANILFEMQKGWLTGEMADDVGRDRPDRGDRLDDEYAERRVEVRRDR